MGRLCAVLLLAARGLAAPTSGPDPLLELVAQRAWGQVLEQAAARLTDSPGRLRTAVAPVYVALAIRESGQAAQRREVVARLLAGRDFAWPDLPVALPVAVDTLCGDRDSLLYGPGPALPLGNQARAWTSQGDALVAAGYPDAALLFAFRYLGYATQLSLQQVQSLRSAFVQAPEELRVDLARRLAAFVPPPDQASVHNGLSRLRNALLELRKSAPAFADPAELPLFLAVVDWHEPARVDLRRELETYRAPVAWEADAWRLVPHVVDDAEAALRAAEWFLGRGDQPAARALLADADDQLSAPEAQRLHWLVAAAASCGALRDAERQRWTTLGEGDRGILGRVDARLVAGDAAGAQAALAGLGSAPKLDPAGLAQLRALAQAAPARAWERLRELDPTAAPCELQPLLAELLPALGLATGDPHGAAAWLLRLAPAWRHEAWPLLWMGGRIVALELLAGDEGAAAQALRAVATRPGFLDRQVEVTLRLLAGSDPATWRHAGPWLTATATTALAAQRPAPALHLSLAKVLTAELPGLRPGATTADVWRRTVLALPADGPGAAEAAQRWSSACAQVADLATAPHLVLAASAMLREAARRPAALALVEPLLARCRAAGPATPELHDALVDLSAKVRGAPISTATLDALAGLTSDWCPDIRWRP